jgi:predicted transcriptional regulator
LDSIPNKRIVLIAIRPRFAESIMKGEKKVEFRKIRFSEKVSHMVIYASKPIQRILGYFQVPTIEEDSPERLWARYHYVSGLSYNEFRNYYAASDKGIAITVGDLWQFKEPMPISKLDKSIHVPQSFSYLTYEIFEMILRKYLSVPIFEKASLL